MAPQAKLAGKRILVVEDQYMIADDLRRLFEANGAEIAGPYASSAAAMQAMPGATFDAAVLDIALAGNAVYPLAAELRRLGTPFVFLTGFSDGDIHPDFADAPAVQKPYRDDGLLGIVASLLAKRG